MKNSYTFPKYSKKVLEAIDSVPVDNFLAFLEKYPSDEIVYRVNKLTKWLIKFGFIQQVPAYTRDSILRAYKAGVGNARRATENILLRKYRQPKFCIYHNKNRKDCPCA